MKKGLFITGLMAFAAIGSLFAQDIKASAVPAAVKAAFAKKIPCRNQSRLGKGKR